VRLIAIGNLSPHRGKIRTGSSSGPDEPVNHLQSCETPPARLDRRRTGPSCLAGTHHDGMARRVGAHRGKRGAPTRGRAWTADRRPWSFHAQYLRDVEAGRSRSVDAPLVTEANLAPLPEPVRRYLRVARAVGHPACTTTTTMARRCGNRLDHQRSGDPLELGRHKDLRTTQVPLHASQPLADELGRASVLCVA
jgi:hypothetical protein